MQVLTRITVASLAAVLVLAPISSFAHCQIPCGIYDDHARYNQLAEHINTIEKSMKQITLLSGADEIDYNQLVRWINNKEAHADKYMEIVTQYFMTQRIKPADSSDSEAYNKYVTQITLLHRMLVSAMKCKQTTDLQHSNELRELLEEFHNSYHPGSR